MCTFKKCFFSVRIIEIGCKTTIFLIYHVMIVELVKVRFLKVVSNTDISL